MAPSAAAAIPLRCRGDGVDSFMAASNRIVRHGFPYEGGRHDISLGLINEAEEEFREGRLWKPTVPAE